MLLMIDNYDSFTYNLVQYLGELGEEVRVSRNDEITLDEIEALAPARIVISPGPCTPKEAGVSVPLIRRFAGRIPILGVCLGHQSIGEAFGGRIVHARQLMHGKTSLIHHDGAGVFRGCRTRITAIRYHSLAIERESKPEVLAITAWTEDGEIMGVRHKTLAVEGVQFHPESILTEHGHSLLKNFLEGATAAANPVTPGVPRVTPQEALARVIEHREIFHEEMLGLMREIMSGTFGPIDCCDRHRPARQEGDHRGDRGRGDGHARVCDEG